MTVAAVALQHPHNYGIDQHNGFLPSKEPISRLDGTHEIYWEEMLDRAIQMPLRFAGGSNTSLQERQSARCWRQEIRQTKVLEFSKDQLDDVRYLRRARVVLSFLAHFYIHSQPNPTTTTSSKSDQRQVFARTENRLDQILEKEEARGKYKTVIPMSIAVPWCTVSKLLELPMILTYADTVLWNWHLIDQRKEIRSDNLAITTTFSNTETERHFFKTSLLIELQGAKALDVIKSSMILAHHREETTSLLLSLELRVLRNIIADMIKIFNNITRSCIPSVFYWDVRTWFNGSDTSPKTYDRHGHVCQEAGKGWIYQGLAQIDTRETLSGPSAGQSSVIHALDIFLGVDHAPYQSRATKESMVQTTSFMQRMQNFMPGPHSRYLSDLETYLYSNIPTSMSTIMQQQQQLSAATAMPYKRPQLIQLLSSECPSNCLVTYNEAVTSLCLLRDQHLKIVTIYILGPARQPPPPHHAPLGANVRIKEDCKGQGERGTGGTELVSFLKGTRNRTRQARLFTMEST